MTWRYSADVVFLTSRDPGKKICELKGSSREKVNGKNFEQPHLSLQLWLERKFPYIY